MRWSMLFAIAAVWMMSGCKATQPGKTEDTVVQKAKELTIGGKDWKNPEADNAQTRKMGQEHFEHHCEVCHGLDGQNTGVPFAGKMSPPVADLASAEIQKYTDGQLKWIIQNGIRMTGMPGWQGIVEENEMWDIVNYIRHLPGKGSLGSPAVYKEEQEEHEHAHGQERSAK